MTAPGYVWPTGEREFTPARAAQGFRDQEHLDAWFVARDHVKACPECDLPGLGYDAPDGWQPTVTRCPEAIRLSEAAR